MYRSRTLIAVDDWLTENVLLYKRCIRSRSTEKQKL